MHDIRTDAYARQLAELIQWEFALIYLLVIFFLRTHARKVQRPLNELLSAESFQPNTSMDRGLAGVGYSDWFKWSGKFQIWNLLLTGAILLLGLCVGY